MKEVTFVGRDSQLKHLFTLYEQSMKNIFQTCFITGNIGTGKTSLIHKFSQELSKKTPLPIITRYQCEINLGKSSPYAPFIDFLIQLNNIDKSIDIQNTIINFDANITSVTEDEIFKQLTSFFRNLTLEKNIVLIIEDMHWMDEPSGKLLQHFFEELDVKNFLIIGSYRLDEINLLDKIHPLYIINDSLKSRDNLNEINLHNINILERQKFIRLILDIEANVLDKDFTHTMLQHTNAEPLFTVELLEHLKQNKNILKNKDEKLFIKKPINWDALPKRVEEIVVERIEKLPRDFREVLKVASVEGTYFTLQVIANILNIPQNILIKQLKIDLGDKYHILQENGTKELEDYTLYQFNFLHTIFQKYIYAQLGKNEKKTLHTKIAEQLELLYCESTHTYLYKLAYHYRLSYDKHKAIEYLTKAGKYALKLSAYKESLTQFDYTLDILNNNPSSKSNNRLKFNTHVLRSAALKATTGWVSEDTTLAYEKALKLGRSLKIYNELAPVIFGLWAVKLMTLELNEAIELANECLEIGKAMRSELTQVQAYIALSNTYFWMGDFKKSSAHANYAINLYQPSQHDDHILKFGYDPLSLGYMFEILSLSAMGQDSDACMKRDQMMDIANKWSHPFSLAICYQGDAWMNYHLNNPEAVQESSQILLELSRKHNFPFYIGMALILGGWANAMLGEEGNHIQDIKDGFKKYIKNSGAMIAHSLYRLILSQVYLEQKKYDLASAHVKKALTVAYKQNELCYEAELLSIKAKTSPKKNFQETIAKAIFVAKEQNSKLFEKRVLRMRSLVN